MSMTKLHYSICIILLLLTGSFISYAQNGIKFKHLGINEGLSQNSVFCMLQDHNGLIWIGTEDGLNKYDGYEFTVYKHKNEDKTSLSHSQVNALLEDKDHNLWVGTSGGLNVMNARTEQFTRFNTSAVHFDENRNFISSLIKDAQDNIWVGTYDGLKMYDRAHKRFLSFNPPGLSATNYNLNKIKALFLDKNQIIWISIGNDLVRFDPARRQFLPLPALLQQNQELRKSNVRVIKQDNSGIYWFGTESAGLFKFDSKSNFVVNYKTDNSKLTTNVVRDILIAGNNELWVGTRDGLNILHTQTNQFTNYHYNHFDPTTLSHNSVRSFLKDNNGNIWLGTFAGGINTYDAESENFKSIAEQTGSKPGLNHSVVSSILLNNDGTLWVGTEGGGLNYVDRKRNIFKYFSVQEGQKTEQSNIVKSIARDNDGSLWVGTYNGLVHFDAKRGITEARSLNKEREDQDKKLEITSVLTDNAGVWVASNGSGLYFIDRQQTVKSYLHAAENKSGLSSDNLTTLLKDNKDNLWIGTQRGLNYFDLKANRFVQFLNDPDKVTSISNNSILSLFTDSGNRLWIGTQGGLDLYDPIGKKFYAITESDGLANNVVHAIQQGPDGSLWISTNKGLSNIRFENYRLPFTAANLVILNYTLDDGLQSNQFSERAVAKANDGELFFGGINGISSFYPGRLIRNTVKPTLIFTDFEIKDKPITVTSENSPLTDPINDTKHITLTYDQAFISIKFAALNYTNPGKNQYAYKLEGLRNDNDWHYAGVQRTASYTNLSAGDYAFKVKAANNDGVWNDAPKTLRITILPPPWKTWWAYVIYATIILSLLYLFYYYSFKTAKLKSELDIEHMLREKDEELAQRKLSFFTNISHEIKTPLTLILAPIEKLLDMNEGNNKVQNQLMLMQRNGDRLVRLINQLLDFRKFESGNMKLNAAKGDIVKFAREVVTAFEAYALDRKIKLKFTPHVKSLIIWYDADKLEKILYNLLSNAMKFTPHGGEVTLTVNKDDNGFVAISVRDNGVGIAEEKIPHLFEQFNHHTDSNINSTGSGIGLSFTKGLIELHHGKIAVESRLDAAGTEGYSCFTVLLPTGSSHLTEGEKVTDQTDSEHISNYCNDQLVVKDMIGHLVNHFDDGEIIEKPVMLVVEDNAEVLEFVASSFENNFKVYKAVNGLEGWQMAVDIIPDIVISDVMMPEMNGTILCSKLKSDARTSHIPVILLTARTPLIYKIEGLETGADDYITKPFSLRILETRVNNLMELRKKLRERFSKDIYLQPTNMAITSPDEKFLKKVMDFIDKNMEESTLNVEEMGKEVGMSRVTLYRKIKALTNQTAIEFIRSVRLKRAAQLLEQNKLNVNEVAYLVGFIDVDYFRKCFKEQFGYTPKEYAAASKS